MRRTRIRQETLRFADIPIDQRAISDARLTNWHFPEIIAYYMGVIFTRSHSTVNTRGGRSLKMRSGNKTKGEEEGRGRGERREEKKGETSCNDTSCIISTDNYIDAQLGHVNINLSLDQDEAA